MGLVCPRLGGLFSLSPENRHLMEANSRRLEEKDRVAMLRIGLHRPFARHLPRLTFLWRFGLLRIAKRNFLRARGRTRRKGQQPYRNARCSAVRLPNRREEEGDIMAQAHAPLLLCVLPAMAECDEIERNRDGKPLGHRFGHHEIP